MLESHLVDISLTDTPVVYSSTVLMAAVLWGYVLGSIPFGIVLTRPFGIDLRKIGSGNIGATNVLRTGRKDLAIATLLLDSGKGDIAAGIAWYFYGPELLPLLAGCAAVVGHNFPIWLGLRGGKGVATTFGVMIATAPDVGLLAVLTWLLVAAVFRYSSLAALLALAAAPLYASQWSDDHHAYAFMGLAMLGWLRHEENIRRLFAGTESKISFNFLKKKEDEAAAEQPAPATPVPAKGKAAPMPAKKPEPAKTPEPAKKPEAKKK